MFLNIYNLLWVILVFWRRTTVWISWFQVLIRQGFLKMIIYAYVGCLDIHWLVRHKVWSISMTKIAVTKLHIIPVFLDAVTTWLSRYISSKDYYNNHNICDQYVTYNRHAHTISPRSKAWCEPARCQDNHAHTTLTTATPRSTRSPTLGHAHLPVPLFQRSALSQIND